jgi:hypothetical protein
MNYAMPCPSVKTGCSTIKIKIFLLYDARPHTNMLTTEVIKKFGWSVLMYPPFSLDLSPSDFHLFGPLKDSL